MTVVPGADTRTVTLICDGCGTSETTPEVTHDDDVVWPMVAALGWAGSPFAAGTHQCPTCSLQPPPAPSTGRSDSERLQGASYELRVHEDSDTMVIAPLTDVDAEAAGGLREALEQAVRTHRHVLMDLRSANVIDSAGLGMLVRARQDAKHHGGTLALAAPSRYVLTVLHTMRLDGVFDVFDDATTALDMMRQR